MTNQSIKAAFQRFWEYVVAKVDNAATNLAESKQDKITGTRGQIVGFDTNGKPVAQEAAYMPKLTGGQSQIIGFGADGNPVVKDSPFMNKNGGTFAGTVKAASGSTGGYYVRNIKFSETAETPTAEGDICFKLK